MDSLELEQAPHLNQLLHPLHVGLQKDWWRWEAIDLNSALFYILKKVSLKIYAIFMHSLMPTDQIQEICHAFMKNFKQFLVSMIATNHSQTQQLINHKLYTMLMWDILPGTFMLTRIRAKIDIMIYSKCNEVLVCLTALQNISSSLLSALSSCTSIEW